MSRSDRWAAPSRWWVALATLPPLAAISVTVLAPSPDGHWVDHLSSVGLKVTQLALLVALTALLARRGLLGSFVAPVVVVVLGIALQVYGDALVANAIWRTTANPGFGVGYESGHQVSGWGDLVVVTGGVGFAIVAAASRRLSLVLAGVAGVLAIIPPPFIWPGAGVLFVMLYVLATGRGLQPRGVSAALEPGARAVATAHD